MSAAGPLAGDSWRAVKMAGVVAAAAVVVAAGAVTWAALRSGSETNVATATTASSPTTASSTTTSASQSSATTSATAPGTTASASPVAAFCQRFQDAWGQMSFNERQQMQSYGTWFGGPAPDGTGLRFVINTVNSDAEPTFVWTPSRGLGQVEDLGSFALLADQSLFPALLHTNGSGSFDCEPNIPSPTTTTAASIDSGIAVVTSKGFTAVQNPAGWSTQGAAVILGVPEGAANGRPTQAFLFHDGAYIGTDTAEGSTRIGFVSRDRDTVTLSYSLYGPSDAMCCPSGQTNVTFRWNGSGFTPDTPIPPLEATRGSHR